MRSDTARLAAILAANKGHNSDEGLAAILLAHGVTLAPEAPPAALMDKATRVSLQAAGGSVFALAAILEALWRAGLLQERRDG